MVTSVKEISGCSRLHSPPKSPKYFNYSCSVICFQTWSNCFVCDLYKSPLSGKTFTLSWVWDSFLLVNVSTLVSTSSCQWLCVTAVWQQPVIYPQEQTNGLPSVVPRNLDAPEEGELASKGAVIGREGMFACERWSLDVLRHKRLLETRLTALSRDVRVSSSTALIHWEADCHLRVGLPSSTLNQVMASEQSSNLTGASSCTRDTCKTASALLRRIRDKQRHEKTAALLLLLKKEKVAEKSSASQTQTVNANLNWMQE